MDVFSGAVEVTAKPGATLARAVIWKGPPPAGPGSLRILATSWRFLVERFEAYLNANGGKYLGMEISDANNRTTEAGIEGAA